MAEIQELKAGKPGKVTPRSLPETAQEVFLDTNHLAARWGTSVTQVVNQRGRGVGPKFIRIGHRTVRYRLRDVLAYERACEMTVTA